MVSQRQGASIKGSCSNGQEEEYLLRPAVRGVENVLNAASAAGSVERVVMTSSVGAVVGDHWERGRDHVFTEADWNQSATSTFLPYHRWGRACSMRCSTVSLDTHTHRVCRKLCECPVGSSADGGRRAAVTTNAPTRMHTWLRRSKVLAEQRAFELCRQQQRWTLATILPSVVQGPPPGARPYKPYSSTRKRFPQWHAAHAVHVVFAVWPAMLGQAA